MITNDTARQFLQYLFAFAKELYRGSSCYLGLSTTTPLANGDNFSEPWTDINGNDTGYARVLINKNVEYKNLEDGNALQDLGKVGFIPDENDDLRIIMGNTKEITMPECKEDSIGYSVTHFGIFTASNGGKPLYTHALTDSDGNPLLEPVVVNPGEVLLFRREALTLEFERDV